MMKRPEAPRANVGYGSYDEVLGALETMLEPGPWILGERFSAADVYLGAELAWAASFGAPGIVERPRLAAYIERAKARPAYQRTISA
ncbi:glutathione S-transferase C-terminal domain-containing protein [Rhizorhabdus argentea]|uniref:glutathione S-transferase C-terminal domain-containing protein n=1 Tax=Rhizorhabdus argentea TaxID=1387174 RepID=UPI003BF4F346